MLIRTVKKESVIGQDDLLERARARYCQQNLVEAPIAITAQIK